MAVHIGDTLKGRYKVIDSLGRGGMADVYKVWDEQRSTYLALKLLRDDLAQDPVFMRRFKREAQNLAGLQHPNIVRFYGLEVDDLKAFILMQYIEGTTLREEILRAGAGGLELERVQQVMGDICSALQYAHNKGLVHCDIKSGNILVDASGKAYLTDFGIARGVDAATSTMVGIGTPAYMAPELIRGEDPTPQTDIYALGIVLYEMLTGGERPFTGERATITGTTAEKVRWEHLKLDPQPITQFNQEVFEQLQQNLLHALQKIPEERLGSASEFWKAINTTISSEIGKNPEKKCTEEEPSEETDVPYITSNFKERSIDKKEQSGIRIVGGILGLIILLILLNNIGSCSSSTSNSSIKTVSTPTVRSSITKSKLPTITYKADLNTINHGECTTIRWDVKDAQQVFFNNEVTGFSGKTSVCPTRTTTYDLLVERLDGEFSYRSATVNVIQEATTIPTKVQQKICEGKIIENGTRVRRDPSNKNSDNVLGLLMYGSEITLHKVDSSGEWGYVSSARLRDGWVFLKCISFSSSCNLLK